MDFKHCAGVVGEATHDADVDAAPFENARARCGGAHFIKRGERFNRNTDLRCERADLISKWLSRARGKIKTRHSFRTQPKCLRASREFIRLQFVATIKQRHRVSRLLLAHTERAEQSTNRDAVRQTHLNIQWRQTQSLKRKDRARNHIDVSRRAFNAERVDVPLHKLAQTAALRAFGAKHVRYRKPLHRHWQRTSARGHHARKRRCELRSQRIIVLAARATKREQFIHDAFTTLRGVELKVFKRGPFDFIEATVNRRAAPRVLDVTTHREVARVKIASALGGLESMRRHRTQSVARTQPTTTASLLP